MVNTIEDLEEKIVGLQDQLEEKEDEIKRLEEALAEAYLTSERRDDT